MNIFGIELSIGELITLLSLVATGFIGWVNVKNGVVQNTKDIEKLNNTVGNISIKVNQHEKEVGIVTTSLSNIQTQLVGVSTRIDTLINFLLEKKGG